MRKVRYMIKTAGEKPQYEWTQTPLQISTTPTIWELSWWPEVGQPVPSGGSYKLTSGRTGRRMFFKNIQMRFRVTRMMDAASLTFFPIWMEFMIIYYPHTSRAGNLVSEDIWNTVTPHWDAHWAKQWHANQGLRVLWRKRIIQTSGNRGETFVNWNVKINKPVTYDGPLFNSVSTGDLKLIIRSNYANAETTKKPWLNDFTFRITASDYGANNADFHSGVGDEHEEQNEEEMKENADSGFSFVRSLARTLKR